MLVREMTHVSLKQAAVANPKTIIALSNGTSLWGGLRGRNYRSTIWADI